MTTINSINNIITNSVDGNRRYLIDSTTNVVTDWEFKRLYDSSTNISMDWDLRQMIDEVGALAINFTAAFRQLYDSSSNLSNDFGNRILYASDGTTHAVDYNNAAGVKFQGVQIVSGVNKTMDRGILGAGGTLVVANGSVTANSNIIPTIQIPGGTPGSLYISARTPGVDFTVTSTSALDTSTFSFIIIEPA